MRNALNSYVTRADRMPQSQAADPRQVENNAGGFTFEVGPVERFKRFLILGSDGGHYLTGAEMTKQNAEFIIDLLDHTDSAGQRDLIDLIVQVSVEGRAPKQSPALFALALVISHTRYDVVKHHGYEQVNAVCRTASTLFEFFSYLNQFQRFGMGARKAIDRWYGSKTIEQVAYQMAKYRQRAGFTHADLLRLSKRIRSEKDGLGESASALLNWAVGKPYDIEALPSHARGLEIAKNFEGLPSREKVLQLIREYSLTWEMLPTEWLTSSATWKALIDSGTLPLGAMLRNLGRMSGLGVFNSNLHRRKVINALTDTREIAKARIHPMNVLIAMKTYTSGHGLRGSSTWEVHSDISVALNQMFHLAFGNVEPTGKRTLIGLDVSGSMASSVLGSPLSAYEATTALSLVLSSTEQDCEVMAFTGEMYPLDIKGRRLDDALREVRSLPFGRTDCSLPMLYAQQRGLEIDTFIVMTDNETWAGLKHPHVALKEYREKTGIDAKLIVLATSSTSFSIADPSDPGMLDISGFDSAVPQLVAEFSKGL